MGWQLKIGISNVLSCGQNELIREIDRIDNMTNTLTPPSKTNVAKEAFSVLDTLAMPWALAKTTIKRQAKPRDYPVMVLPGFGTNDVSTAPLRYFLSKNGFSCMGWNEGLNLGGKGLIDSPSELSPRWDVEVRDDYNGEAEVPALCDKITEKVEAYCQRNSTKIHLVGWSLGGYIAREVARDLPDQVVSITTMGSPVKGGPKYTSVAPLFRARKMDLDWIEREIEKRNQVLIKQPITAIYSKRDGVVAWQAMMDDHNPNFSPVEVNISHLGLGLNKKVWDIVLQSLINAEQSHQSGKSKSLI